MCTGGWIVLVLVIVGIAAMVRYARHDDDAWPGGGRDSSGGRGPGGSGDPGGRHRHA